MQVIFIYKKPIFNRIADKISEAERAGKKIDKFILNDDECDELWDHLFLEYGKPLWLNDEGNRPISQKKDFLRDKFTRTSLLGVRIDREEKP